MRIIFCFLVFTIPEIIFAQATDLFISEYIEGSSYNKALEIYNGTGYTVDLLSYRLEQDNSGNDTFSIALNLNGTLENDNVFVITRPSADQRLVSVADTLSGLVTNFNGDDQIRLIRDSIEIDRIGITGDINFGKDVTYIRKSYINVPAAGEQDPRGNGEWEIYENDYFGNLGSHNYTAGFGDLKPKIIQFDYFPKHPNADQNIAVSITAIDDSGQVNAKLYFSVNDQYSVLDMLKQDTIFTAMIPSSFFMDGDRLEYYALVEDIAGQKDSTLKVKVFTGTSSIKDLKMVNEDGRLLYRDYLARIEGTLTTDLKTFANYAFLQDESAGIQWRCRRVFPELKIGHFVSITGEIKQNNGLAEIISEDSTGFTDYGPAIPPAPKVFSISDLNGIAESVESMLVTLPNVRITDGQWPEKGESANIQISDDSKNNFNMFIDRQVNIDDSNFPESITFNASGIIFQSDSTLPYNSGYKIMPRSLKDIDVITSLKNKIHKTAVKFKLYPAFPNPFNSHTIIHFDLPPYRLNQNTELTIYNSLGQIIRKVFNKRIQPGSHHFLFNANSLSSGSYLVVLKNGSFYRFSRFVLIK